MQKKLILLCASLCQFYCLYNLISHGQDTVPDKLLNTIGICGRKHN